MLASLCAFLLAAPGLGVEAGDPIQLDGRIDAAEWADARSASGNGVHLRYKRTGPWLAVAVSGDQAYKGEIVRFYVTDPRGIWVTELLLSLGQPAMPPGLWRRGYPETIGKTPYECPRACRVRVDFTETDRWSVEYLVRLTAFGIGRGDRWARRGMILVNRQLPEPAPLFGLPAGSELPSRLDEYVPLADGDWGADETWAPVSPETSREFDDHELLHRLYREHEATSLREVADVLVIANAVRPRSLTRIKLLRSQLEEGRARNPGLTQWTYFLGRLLHEANFFDEARTLVESVPEPLSHLDPFANLVAEHYLDTQEWETALRVCKANTRVRGMLETVKFTLTGRRAWADEQPRLEADAAKMEKHPRVRLVTSKGPIEIELFEDDAPNAVLNFMDLVMRAGFYDRLRFHDVSGGFGVHVGDPRTRPGTSARDDGPGWLLRPDASPRPALRGYVFTVPLGNGAMHGSMFGIAVAPFINPKRAITVFGRVVEGMKVVDSLEYEDRLERVEVLFRRNHPYDAIAARVQR